MSLNKIIKESSLSRLWKHIQHESCKSWAIITSYRDDLGDKNPEVFRQFAKELRDDGLGYVLLVGYGNEEVDGKVIQKHETSLFIPNISLEQSQKFVSKYKQDGFIYSGPEVDDKIINYWQGVVFNTFITWHPDKIGKFYSKLRGRPFVFERVGIQNWIDGLSVFGN